MLTRCVQGTSKSPLYVLTARQRAGACSAMRTGPHETATERTAVQSAAATFNVHAVSEDQAVCRSPCTTAFAETPSVSGADNLDRQEFWTAVSEKGRCDAFSHRSSPSPEARLFLPPREALPSGSITMCGGEETGVITYAQQARSEVQQRRRGRSMEKCVNAAPCFGAWQRKRGRCQMTLLRRRIMTATHGGARSPMAPSKTTRLECLGPFVRRHRGTAFQPSADVQTCR